MIVQMSHLQHYPKSPFYVIKATLSGTQEVLGSNLAALDSPA